MVFVLFLFIFHFMFYVFYHFRWFSTCLSIFQHVSMAM